MPIAQTDLAVLTADADEDLPGAALLATAATEAADPQAAARAHLVLGVVQLEQGQLAAARTHLTRAAESGFVEITTSAQVQLARLAADGGELDNAVALLDSLRSLADAEAPGLSGRSGLSGSEVAPASVGQTYLDHCDYLFEGATSGVLRAFSKRSPPARLSGASLSWCRPRRPGWA
jgi:hypothetical protein